jgi:5-hydroxyisourate hydrolase
MERPLLSVHAVDIARGAPAAGLRMVLLRRTPAGPELLASRIADCNGKTTFGVDVVSARHLPCRLTLNLDLGGYYRELSPAGFVTVAPFNFVLTDAACHYHLPAKITPYGMSLFVTRSG